MGKYLAIFVWVTLFLYFYNMVFPKNGWYLLIGIPVVSVTSLSILKFFEKREATKNQG